MSAWVSLPQWLMTTWNKQTWCKNPLQCYHSKDKIPRALKRFVCKLLWFLLRRRFCRKNWYFVAQLYTSLISRYYFYNHASRSQEGKILRWKKHVGQQAHPASQCSECSLPANKWKTEGQNAHSSWLYKVVQPTVAQTSFHAEFLSSIRFSPLRLLRRWKRNRNFLAFSLGHEDELKLHVSLSTTKANYSDKNHWIKNSSLALSYNWNHTAIHITCDNWRWILNIVKWNLT